MFVRQDFAVYYIFLLGIQCTTFCIENRRVKRANSHFTICSLLTLTHIIFERQKVSVFCLSLSLTLCAEKIKKYLKMSKLWA